MGLGGASGVGHEGGAPVSEINACIGAERARWPLPPTEVTGKGALS